MRPNRSVLSSRRNFAVGAVALFAAAAASPAAHAAYYKVFTSSIAADKVDSTDNYCSLAEAVKSINGGSAVANCQDLNSSEPGMITLIEAPNKPYVTYPYRLGANPITLNKSVRIQPSEEGLTAYIESTGLLAFKVNSPANVTFYGLDIKHTGTGNGRLIWNASTLSLSRTTVRNGNVKTETAGKGGGIYNQGSLTLSACQVLKNSAKVGGGIYNDDGSIPFLDATIANNTATMAGGGLYNYGSVSFDPVKGNIALSAIITNNTAPAGGGILNRGIIHVEGTSTIGYNTASGTGSLLNLCHTASTHSCDGYGGAVLNIDSVNANNVNVTAAFQVYAATSMSTNMALGGFGGAFYNTGQLNLSGLAIDKNQAKSGAAIFTAALGTSHYCTFDSTLSSSITNNSVVVAGGYSIVDGSGADGNCTFLGVTASGGNSPPKCNPSAVKPGYSCP